MSRKGILILVFIVTVVVGVTAVGLRFETYRTREGLFRRERFTGRVWRWYERGWNTGWEPVRIPSCSTIDNTKISGVLNIYWNAFAGGAGVGSITGAFRNSSDTALSSVTIRMRLFRKSNGQTLSEDRVLLDEFPEIPAGQRGDVRQESSDLRLAHLTVPLSAFKDWDWEWDVIGACHTVYVQARLRPGRP